MEVREMLDFYEIPENIRLEDIETNNKREDRLLNRLMVNNINTIGDLKKYSDEELMQMKFFKSGKLEKLREFLTDWYENNLVVENRINITDINTIITSLQEDVFGSYKNQVILAMRGNYQTYSRIGEKLGQSRQGVHENERTVQRKFLRWYQKNDIKEKIGDYREFYFYCDKNFPDSQLELKVAVRKLTELARIYEKKNSPETGTVSVGG